MSPKTYKVFRGDLLGKFGLSTSKEEPGFNTLCEPHGKAAPKAILEANPLGTNWGRDMPSVSLGWNSDGSISLTKAYSSTMYSNRLPSTKRNKADPVWNKGQSQDVHFK